MNTQLRKVQVVIPTNPRISITYMKADRTIDTYEVSGGAIEQTHDSMTFYVFGKGIRTFKRDGIIDAALV